LIEHLLNAGADPNGNCEEGQTALMTASRNGKVDAVKLLLTRGAKVNAKEGFRGQTALMWAASEGNAAAAEMLVEFGAEVNAKIEQRLYRFVVCVRNAHIEAAETLLKHGANVNDVAPDGTSTLNMAVVNAPAAADGQDHRHGAGEVAA
jgi:ankyrin repeat protein